MTTTTVRLYVDIAVPLGSEGLEILQEQIATQERVQLSGMDSALTYYGRLTGAIQTHGGPQ